MSLYERVDRYAAPKSKDNLEYLAVYAACFCVLLLPVAARRLTPWATRRMAGLSILGETSAIATNYARSSFVGL
jgi:hypothetical protein